jgi:hypothetical protein
MLEKYCFIQRPMAIKYNNFDCVFYIIYQAMAQHWSQNKNVVQTLLKLYHGDKKEKIESKITKLINRNRNGEYICRR